MIYYIADMHFCHENVLRFDERPFENTDQMDEALVSNWNARVTDEDTVYVLGDAFWKNEENSVRLIQRLKGHKRLIRGNHDRVHGRLYPYWESVEPYTEINDGDTRVILCHYPILFYKNQRYGAVMLYGHVHNTQEWQFIESWTRDLRRHGIPGRLINVGCMMDYMRYTPRTLEELLAANPVCAAGGDKSGETPAASYFTDIKDAADRIAAYTDVLYVACTAAVNAVITGAITDAEEIQRLLCVMDSFHNEERFTELSKKLCRHIYYHYPQLVGKFKNMFRLSFDEIKESGME